MDAPLRELADRILSLGGRVLVAGGARRERESLVISILSELAGRGVSAAVVSGDLGLPLVGPPGAISMGRLEDGRLHSFRTEAICSLDAARFRLPLVLALERLVDEAASELLLIEAPRVSRGMGAAELLGAFLARVAPRVVLRIGSGWGRELPSELAAMAAEVIDVDPALAGESGEAVSASARIRARTRLWDEFLSGASPFAVRSPLDGMPVIGAPPPSTVTDAWCRRQVALVDDSGRTVAFGELDDFGREEVRLRACRFLEGEPVALLVRDARRDRESRLTSDRSGRDGSEDVAPRRGGTSFSREPGVDLRVSGPPGRQRLFPPVMTLTTAKAFLVNGIFGDPLLHVRLRHRRRSLLFDLGDGGRLAARIAHQVSDVFVSHAHFDHFGGFPWLLRSSIGSPRLRRIYGPAGLTANVQGMMAGILWDRIGARGPVFEVVEVHGDRLSRSRVRAGRNDAERLPERVMEGDVLLEEPEFRVRVRTLDHGVPVLAFALEESRALHVRRDRLLESGIPAGPWLSELKRLVLEDEGDVPVTLPDGRVRTAKGLADELILSSPGEKLVYATDFDDNEANRASLVELAEGARVLFCEASFLDEDVDLARSTHHLTAGSCGRIAALAGVSKLVPFHFSKRYERDPERVYREIRAQFSRTVMAS